MNESVATLPRHRLFVGTYSRGGSRGIYTVELDRVSGSFTEPVLAAETGNPSFLAVSSDRKRVFAVNDSPALAVSFSVSESGALHRSGLPSSTHEKAPSHVAVDRTGQLVLVSHFAHGFVAALRIERDGTLGSPHIIRHAGRGFDPARQEAPHVHSATISPDNRFAIVCDLGLDKIFTYALDPARTLIAAASPPSVSTAPGAGPRHSAFSPDGRHLYVINEMAGTITAWRYDPARGGLTFLSEDSTLPAAYSGTNTTAEVCVHPSGRFVYGSNRGHDSLAVFSRDSASGLLSRIEIVPCGGEHPRHFALSPDGTWLVCANMNSDSLTVFRVDQATGRLTRFPGTAHVSLPVCVVFYS